jgi:hypothetical protein
MEGLRIELGRERLDSICIDAKLAGGETLANVKVFEVYRWGRFNFSIHWHFDSLAKPAVRLEGKLFLACWSPTHTFETAQ